MRFLTCALVLFATAGSAQSVPEPLFVELPATMSAVTLRQPTIRAEIVSRRAVGMRLDRLFAATRTGESVALNVGAEPWIARFERIDIDAAGFRSWVGTIDGIDHSHVVVTERDGIVSGLVDGVETTYQITTTSPGLYVLEQVDRSKLGGELEPLRADDVVQDPHSAAPSALPSAVASDDASTIDVLFLYTPRATAARGGVAAIQAAAAQIISDSNTAYGRSGITTRVRGIGTVEFALTEAAQMGTDLSTLRNAATARALRNQYNADVVQLLVSSPDPNTCGIAYLLTTLNNPGFDAYSVSDVACLSQYTPTHEMGHNMGAHHAPEDGATGALFSYSYGYKDPVRGFRTVMAYACSGGVSCARILNLSNPGVQQSGGATGSSSQNNALSTNNAAATVANFRQSGAPTPPLTPPSTPTGLRSAVNGTNVTLWWDAASDLETAASPATNYTLRVGSSPGASNIYNAFVGNVTTVSGAVGAGVYYWRLIASNSAGQSPTSAEAQFTVGPACTPPGVPQNFNFAVNARTVTLTWTAPATGGAPTTYIIEAGSATGLANLFYGSTGSATPGAVTPAPPGTYFVRIRSQNACGLSAASNERVIVVQ